MHLTHKIMLGDFPLMAHTTRDDKWIYAQRNSEWTDQESRFFWCHVPWLHWINKRTWEHLLRMDVLARYQWFQCQFGQILVCLRNDGSGGVCAEVGTGWLQNLYREGRTATGSQHKQFLTLSSITRCLQRQKRPEGLHFTVLIWVQPWWHCVFSSDTDSYMPGDQKHFNMIKRQHFSRMPAWRKKQTGFLHKA